MLMLLVIALAFLQIPVFYKQEGTVYKGRCFSWDKEKIKEWNRLKINFELPPAGVAVRSVRILLYAFRVMHCPLSYITLTATVTIPVAIKRSPEMIWVFTRITSHWNKILMTPFYLNEQKLPQEIHIKV